MDSNNEKKLVLGELYVGDSVYITSDKYPRIKNLIGLIKNIHDYMGYKTYRVEIDSIRNPRTEDGLYIFRVNDLVKIDSATITPNGCMTLSIDDKLFTGEYYMDAKEFDALYNAKYGGIEERFKEGENEMKLLEIYRDRKMDKIFKELDTAQDKAWEKDSTYKTLKDLSEKTKTKNGYLFTFNFDNMPDSVREEINKAQKNREEKEVQLSRLMDEVNAQLSECETYEQKINILKTYEILDEKGKVNA